MRGTIRVREVRLRLSMDHDVIVSLGERLPNGSDHSSQCCGYGAPKASKQ
jgi:hypothetical protein